MYEKCKEINHDGKSSFFFTNASKENNRIAYYASNGKNGFPYQIDHDDLENMFLLLPDIMFKKNVFYVFEESNNKRTESLLLKLLNDYGVCRQISSIFTSAKHNKTFAFFEFKPNLSNLPNPQFVPGNNNVEFYLTNLTARKGTQLIQDNPIIARGQNSCIFSTDFVPVPASNSIVQSVTIRNIGNNKTKVYVGYIFYDKEKNIIGPECYPERNQNCVLEVVSAKAGESSIYVDKMPLWRQKCRVALFARDDMMDVPNQNLLEGEVVSVESSSNSLVEIKMNKALENDIQQGTSIRIQGIPNASVYKMVKVLSPGEGLSHNSSIAQFDTFPLYSAKAISRGVSYVKPLILSYSFENKDENTIEIQNWTLTY